MATGVRARILLATFMLLAMMGAACSSGDDAANPSSSDAEGTTSAESEGNAEAEPIGTGTCDDTDPTACLLPWPSDTLTRTDPSTPTGVRLDLPVDGMPANVDGTPIDPTEWNRNDGFSPASIPQAVIPDLDVDASGLPPQTDIGASLEQSSNLVLLDLDTGERVPAWAEIDISVEDRTRAPVRIVPARALIEGHRHAVGLWSLVRTDGAEVEPTNAFAELVADPDGEQAAWLDALAEDSGRPTDQLDLAWSFTVASTESLTGRLRHMWAETAEELGVDPEAGVTAGGAPPFTVSSSTAQGPVTVVEGSFEMPKYLTGDGGTGEVLNNGDDPEGLPSVDGTMPAPFTCVVPTAPAEPVPFIVYGHGLLGSRSEVLAIGSLGASAGIGFCALDYIGMSTEDVPTVLDEFADLSAFRTQPDRLQQGHLGFILLGRLLTSAEGFGTDPAFQIPNGESMVLAPAVSFLGASQGGILGGPATALSPDWSRATFAVGGLGYNLLLRRSVDFDAFAPVLEASYPDELDQALALELTEQLWDRGENAGWAQHLTADGFPEGGDATTVLLLEAFGDHQVANVSTEKLARTLDVPRRVPSLADGRSTDPEPFFGIEPIESFPHPGSALLVWDFGTPAPPAANTPPREGDDPHGDLGDEPAALALLLAFVQPDGTVTDVCGPGPCTGG